MKISAFALFFFCSISYSCSQQPSFGPGYRWDLFENTPNWELAKAVSQEDTLEIYRLVRGKASNVDLQEPKFGRTLLMLAVGNEKARSVSALLNVGANVHLRDNQDEQAIHEAVSFLRLKNNAFPILKELIKHGADVNADSEGSANVPLVSALDDSSCARLLLDSGADLYYKTADSNYTVWRKLSDSQSDAIYLAKEVIIKKKMPVPNPVLYTWPDHEPRSFSTLLNILPCFDADKCKVRDEILKYLQKPIISTESN